MGQPQEALAATEEAVAIQRRDPDEFLPELATSISVVSDSLAALDRFNEAAGEAHRALEILAPLVERDPDTYGELARTVGGDVMRYSQGAGIAPDLALLQRVAHAIGGADSG